MVRVVSAALPPSRELERTLIFNATIHMKSRANFFFVLALVATNATAETIDKLTDFELSDQHSAVRRYDFPRNKIIFMTVADNKGSKQLAPWIQPLRDRYGTRIDIDGIADVSMIPKPFHGMFRKAFVKELTYSVMLDWDGNMVKKFAYTPGIANVYVIGRDGQITKKLSGPATEQGIRELTKEIDAALGSSR